MRIREGAYYISTESKFVSLHAQLSKFNFRVGWLRCYAAQQFISTFETLTPYFNLNAQHIRLIPVPRDKTPCLHISIYKTFIAS